MTNHRPIAVGTGQTLKLTDSVTNQASIQVAAGGRANFPCLVTGAGNFTGSGLVDIEGTPHLGNSPAQVA